MTSSTLPSDSATHKTTDSRAGLGRTNYNINSLMNQKPLAILPVIVGEGKIASRRCAKV